jgi:hypothetical protein
MANYIDALFNAELNHHWYLINAVTVYVDFQVSDYATYQELVFPVANGCFTHACAN